MEVRQDEFCCGEGNRHVAVDLGLGGGCPDMDLPGPGVGHGDICKVELCELTNPESTVHEDGEDGCLFCGEQGKDLFKLGKVFFGKDPDHDSYLLAMVQRTRCVCQWWRLVCRRDV